MQTGDLKKQINIVAGPNGSGKTTFAESFFQNTMKNSIYLNPDLIASGYSTIDFQQASFLAGKVLLREIKSRIADGENFVFESTLSGRTYFGILEAAKKLGYHISVYFLYLDSISKNIERINERVLLGGHHIPVEAVERRHLRCFGNFWNLYRGLCDDWFVFDNSGMAPVLKMRAHQYENLSAQEKMGFEEKFLKGIVK